MLIGQEGLNTLANSKVVIFGIGGVGTFVAEGLARSGVGKFILCDDDDICLTNINRQIHATRSTVGKSKVETMRDRILDINPNAEVVVHHRLYNSESAEEILPEQCDYVVDAIDMVSAKLDLIERCNAKGFKIMSSMGTGNKMNPMMLEVTDIKKTSVCPLARVMRRELKNRRIKKLKVLYSKEDPIKPIQTGGDCKTDCICPGTNERNCSTRRGIPGSISFVPSVAGLIIASEVVKDLIGK